MSNKDILLLVQQTIKRVNQTIDLHYEDDDCTQCYVQGLQDALDEFDYLVWMLENEANEEFYDEIARRKHQNVADNQLTLL